METSSGSSDNPTSMSKIDFNFTNNFSSASCEQIPLSTLFSSCVEAFFLLIFFCYMTEIGTFITTFLIVLIFYCFFFVSCKLMVMKV